MEQLVEGDVVVLKRGDQVPADAIVLTSDSLSWINSLTGENDPAAKRPGDMVPRPRAYSVVPAASCFTWVRTREPARFRRARSVLAYPA